MREHLYRGKCIETCEWAFGSLLIINKEDAEGKPYKAYFIVNEENYKYEVYPETVGEFIGLKYKNGVKIFEGDIFTVCGRCPKLVKFIDKRAAFCIANVDQLKDEKWLPIWGSIDEVWWNDFKDEIDAIGNIHDNPELLWAQEEQLTKEQAIALYESGFWETMSYEERAKFQMTQERLCMPFNIFSEAMSKCLKRPVYTHEFTTSNRDNLIAELFNGKPAPTLSEIINLIPADKLVFIET